MKYPAPKARYIATFRLVGVPVYIFWSFPIAGCLSSAFVGKFIGAWNVTTVLASTSAYLLLILAHEAGHAFFARRAKADVYAITVTGGAATAMRRGFPTGQIGSCSTPEAS